MKFKFIHKISTIQEKFLVFYNLLRGPDITRSGAGSGSGPQVVYPGLSARNVQAPHKLRQGDQLTTALHQIRQSWNRNL